MNKHKAITALLLSAFLVWSLDATAQINPPQIEINDGNLQFKVAVPFGWRIHHRTANYCLLCPERMPEGSHESSIVIGIQPTEGKQATRLFDSDELVGTADGKQALMRPYRWGMFQSIIQPSDLTYPGTVAYITEGEKFVIINLGSDDKHYREDEKALKEIVRSYRKAT
jgi:hypothetical protein